MSFAPDGRLFVTEQGGALRVIKNGALLPAPFVTVPVNATGERGLLGVAFHPSFLTNGFVYIYYTATTPTVHNRVSRFTAIGDVAWPGSEVVILDLEPLVATNHNGGAIHFGKDGKLYVAVGDNAVGSNAQTLTNRLGKMLRINADGTIPSDNPFYTTATGANRAIWALGLRNPYTFAFEPILGNMLINDVGEQTWEEVNEGIRGANYGWPSTEGPTNASGIAGPVYAYTHGSGCAISGGAFHNLARPQFPFNYWGTYFFADFCGGWIRALHADGTFTEFATGISRPVDLASASDGSLYYLARGTGSDTGTVHRISYVPTTPRVDVTANGVDGPVLLTFISPVHIRTSFDAGAAGQVQGVVYLGVTTLDQTLWVNANQTFTTTVTPAYSGPLSSYQPATFLNLPIAGVLPQGFHWWFMVVVPSNGSGVLADMVLTVFP